MGYEMFKSMKSAFAVKYPKEINSNGDVSRPRQNGKKKSLDFLANSLLQKAVAKSRDSINLNSATSSISDPPISFASSLTSKLPSHADSPITSNLSSTSESTSTLNFSATVNSRT